MVVDFSGVASMQSVILENHGDEQADGGRTAQIMRFDVVDRPAPPRITIPDPLRTVRDYFNPSGTGRDFLDLRVGLGSRPKPVTRAFEFDRGGGEFSINGQHFAGPCQLHGEPERFDAIVVEGTDEIWEVSNSSGGWYHPVHIHDNEWQVLDRNGQPPQNFLDLAPHWAIFPGLLIFLTVLSINYIGDGLRDALDPRKTQ